MRYEPTLDGVRAVAVLAVIAFHTRNASGGMNGGFLGVDVFFVLSGFLITTLLAEEKKANGSIDIKAFYLRRLARLTPALFLFLGSYMLFGPLIAPEYGLARHLSDALLAGLYLSDYSKAFWGIPDFLQHSWSLSVEEHFYLIWPFAILALSRTRNPEKTLLVALAAAFAWKLLALSIEPYGQVYYRFDTRLTGLLLGGWLAFRLGRSTPSHPITPRLSIYAASTLLFLFATAPFENKAAFFVGGAAAELATSLLIASLVCGRASATLQRLLAHRAMTSLGKISYGMYLWHFPIALLVRESVPFLPAFLIVTAATMLFASISYFTVEAFFRRPSSKPVFSS